MRVSRAVYLAGLTSAAGIAIAIIVMMAQRDAATYPMGIKGDRLEITIPADPQADCAQVVWPYGCEWMNSSPAPKRHLRPGQTRPHYYRLGWS